MQLRLLALLREDPRISYESLAERLDTSRNTVKRGIQQLKLGGKLRRLGPKKNGYWDVVG